jgi:hypothetical protein
MLVGDSLTDFILLNNLDRDAGMFRELGLCQPTFRTRLFDRLGQHQGHVIQRMCLCLMIKVTGYLSLTRVNQGLA